MYSKGPGRRRARARRDAVAEPVSLQFRRLCGGVPQPWTGETPAQALATRTPSSRMRVHARTPTARRARNAAHTVRTPCAARPQALCRAAHNGTTKRLLIHTPSLHLAETVASHLSASAPELRQLSCQGRASSESRPVDRTKWIRMLRQMVRVARGFYVDEARWRSSE